MRVFFSTPLLFQKCFKFFKTKTEPAMFMKTSVHGLGGAWYKSSIYAGKKTWQLFTLSKMILILLSSPSATWTGSRYAADIQPSLLAKARGCAPHGKKANSSFPGRSCAEDSRNPSVPCHGNSPQTNWYQRRLQEVAT